MKPKKNTTTIFAIIFISILLYLKSAHGFTKEYYQYGNDALIVILLLVFAERILLFTFFLPFAFYKKIKSMLVINTNS